MTASQTTTEDIYKKNSNRKMVNHQQKETATWALMTASHSRQPLKIYTVNQQQKDSSMDTDDCFSSQTATADIYRELVTETVNQQQKQ